MWEWAYVERAAPDVGTERAVMQQRLEPVWLLQVMERGKTALDTAVPSFHESVAEPQAGRGSSTWRSTPLSVRWPQNAIVRSSSRWMISSAFVTPGRPIAPRPYRNARPM